MYNIAHLLSTFAFGIFLISCQPSPTTMPTEELVDATENQEPPAAYQLIYETHNVVQPDPNQQRVRVLLWLERMNCNLSQLQKLEELRQLVLNKQSQLEDLERTRTQKIQEAQTPIFNQIWDLLRQGVRIEDEAMAGLLNSLQDIQTEFDQSSTLDARLEGIKSIIEAEGTFLKSLSPEQEATLVDALFFLRYQLDPIGNPRDFSLLVGNTFEPGQYAILLKGTSKLARQSNNIGGLWSDEPELTGRVLHEAQREVIVYLALLEPSLEEAIRVAMDIKRSNP